jgi:hypothetical protein
VHFGKVRQFKHTLCDAKGDYRSNVTEPLFVYVSPFDETKLMK